MSGKGRKNKRGDRGLIEEENLNDTKRPNMTARGDEETSEYSPPEPTLAELKQMLTEIQTSVSNILEENLLFKEELKELRSAYKSQKRELDELKTSMAVTVKANMALKADLASTKERLVKEMEETDLLKEEIDDLEQYTRKNSLEIHGVPEDAYTSTEDVVTKLGEVLEVPISSEDIEISHKLKTRSKAIIVKFLNHKVKSKLYKCRVKLKHVKPADVFPSASYSVAIDREPRLFINENLTAYRRDIMKKANGMRRDQLIQSAWTLDGKVFVKTSPEGQPVRIYCLEDLDNL